MIGSHRACARRRLSPACWRALVVSVATVLLPVGVPHAQTAASPAATSYADRAEVRAFIDEMVTRHGFDRGALEQAFARARFQAPIVKAMEPVPTGRRSWEIYRRGFVNARNVEDGAVFWQTHREALARSESTYGVPAEIIVAIIGIETRYGRAAGNWRVLEALATLAFDYPRRAAFFRSELEHFLLLTRESRLDASSVRGSFAGAVGIPQFMPGSWRRWAVDFDGDGRRDLLSSPVDAIGSVGNFLREHGWVRGQPTAFGASVEGGAHKLLLEAGIKPAFTAGELADYGIRTTADLADDTPVALVELETPDAPSAYWIGLDNFYAITRYNQSSFYAISVIELGRALRERVGRPAARGG